MWHVLLNTGLAIPLLDHVLVQAVPPHQQDLGPHHQALEDLQERATSQLRPAEPASVQVT